MGKVQYVAEFGRGGPQPQTPRLPSGCVEKTGLYGGFAQRELDPAQVFLHDTQQVGEVAGTVWVRPPDGDHLVVPDAVTQH